MWLALAEGTSQSKGNVHALMTALLDCEIVNECCGRFKLHGTSGLTSLRLDAAKSKFLKLLILDNMWPLERRLVILWYIVINLLGLSSLFCGEGKAYISRLQPSSGASDNMDGASRKVIQRLLQLLRQMFSNSLFAAIEWDVCGVQTN